MERKNEEEVINEEQTSDYQKEIKVTETGTVNCEPFPDNQEAKEREKESYPGFKNPFEDAISIGNKEQKQEQASEYPNSIDKNDETISVEPVIKHFENTVVIIEETESACTSDIYTEKEENDDNPNKTQNDKKEKLIAPVGEPIISGPIQVSLALGSEWKRRYLTLVADNLYIWTSHR